MTLTRQHKRRITFALMALIGLDVLLLVLNWQAASAVPAEQRARLERLREQHDLLGADVKRAAEIRQRLPEIERQLDRFLAEQLLDSGGGYPTMVGDLTRISNESGLRTSGITYKQRELEKRDVIEVEVGAAVEGDYSSLVKFINGLEQSKHFYLLDGLSLAANTTGGGIKLNLQLRTYFRLRK